MWNNSTKVNCQHLLWNGQEPRSNRKRHDGNLKPQPATLSPPGQDAPCWDSTISEGNAQFYSGVQHLFLLLLTSYTFNPFLSLYLDFLFFPPTPNLMAKNKGCRNITLLKLFSPSPLFCQVVFRLYLSSQCDKKKNTV